jgi:putative DNA primase/helicase
LPSDRHAAKLTELAKRLDQDLVALGAEFSDFCAAESSATATAAWAVERWGAPVATAALLQELIDKIGKHIIARPHELLAIALWVTMAWVHESAATHSVFLVATSAEPDSGKTTLLGVLGFLLPKPFAGAEPTGPSIYRFVDREKPTLIVDEADDLFARKTDAKHIFNASWTRGTKIPRQVQGVTHWFDPFSPKVVGLLGMQLPRTLVGRSIVIKLWPKRPDEKVENFSHTDDQEFTDLRRKLARWAADNAAALKEATPPMPTNFGNRLAANWRLLFAIAELAGGVWPNQARQAAERLSRTTRTPSLGLQLLAAIRDMFASGRMEITSQQVVDDLTADPDGIWREYRGKSPITQRQVADLLKPYDIRPVVVHPTKRRDLSRHGCKSQQFVEAFQRLLPPIRTSEHRLQTPTSRARN